MLVELRELEFPWICLQSTTQSVTDNSTQVQHNCRRQLERGEQQLQQRRPADLTACSEDLPPAYYDSVAITTYRLQESYEMACSMVFPPPYDETIRNYHDNGNISLMLLLLLLFNFLIISNKFNYI